MAKGPVPDGADVGTMYALGERLECRSGRVLLIAPAHAQALQELLFWLTLYPCDPTTGPDPRDGLSP